MIYVRCFVRFLLAIFILPKNVLLYCLGYLNRGKSQIVDALFSDGYFVYGDRLPVSEIDKLRDIFYDMGEQVDMASSGQSNGRIMMPHLKSEYIAEYAARFFPVAKDFFNHSSVDIELSMFQISKVETDMNNIPGGGYHVDDNKKNLKFFVYLTDVNEKNGPFTLSPRSHGLTWLKVVRGFGWEVTTNRKYFYMEELPEGCQPPIQVLGEKGTIFCADTTIYHKAERITEGERLVLVISFAENRLDPYRLLYKNKVAYE